jgi:acetyltransferase
MSRSRRLVTLRDSVSRSSSLLGPGVAHKAVLGGVHVGITSAADLEVALDAIDRIATRSSRGYLVEAQVPDSTELLVGGVRDPVWGPVIAFGRGGRDAERHRPQWRVAPLADLDVANLVAEVDPTLDAEALAPVLRAVEVLLLSHPEIIEVDVNPVRLIPAGAVALDALIVRKGQEE